MGNTIGYTLGMKLGVSLSERLCKEAGAAAKALGVSRNKLVQAAKSFWSVGAMKS